jgi:malonate transporter and related proteins
VQALLQVILPVFLVIGAGYLAVRLRAFPEEGADALMKFTQNFAIPCLLFAGIVRLDLSAALDWALLLSFYAGATAGFLAGLFGARLLFGRPWEDAIAIGFACLFSNSVLLGLPITERAYGANALEANIAIIAFHAPFCYALGMTVMESSATAAARGARPPGNSPVPSSATRSSSASRSASSSTSPACPSPWSSATRSTS